MTSLIVVGGLREVLAGGVLEVLRRGSVGGQWRGLRGLIVLACRFGTRTPEGRWVMDSGGGLRVIGFFGFFGIRVRNLKKIHNFIQS